MGSRNPFRVSIDPKTKYVYWGDVGPDTKVPSAEGGLISYDEINQARKPGFYGWPYFVGNEALPKYDFATKKEGAKKDPLRPINDSPNNTGLRELPPAQSPMIWYNKGESQPLPAGGERWGQRHGRAGLLQRSVSDAPTSCRTTTTESSLSTTGYGNG